MSQRGTRLGDDEDEVRGHQLGLETEAHRLSLADALVVGKSVKWIPACQLPLDEWHLHT